MYLRCSPRREVIDCIKSALSLSDDHLFACQASCKNAEQPQICTNINDCISRTDLQAMLKISLIDEYFLVQECNILFAYIFHVKAIWKGRVLQGLCSAKGGSSGQDLI